MRRWLVLALAVAVTLTAGAQPTPAVITIDASQVIAEVSPLAFGANFGPLNVLPVDLQDEAKAISPLYLRFPGGRVGDLGDIPNSQIDLYMAVCRMLECTPAISARLEGGTPERAAEMVRYVNVTKEYGVQYWSVGNEPNLWDDYTPERHAAEWRVFAEAMLEVDPDIILVGPDTSQFTGVEGDSNANAHAYLREFLRVNGDLVDIVSVHRYPFGTQQATIEGLQADAAGWSTLVENLHTFVAEELGREVPVAITEVSSDWSAVIGQSATPDSYPAALWWADVFGQIIGGNVEIVAYFNLQSADRLGGHGIFDRYDPRPTYDAFLLYRQFGSRVVATEHDGDVRAYAALRDDGALTVMLVNWDDAPRDVTLQIDGFDAAGPEIEIADLTEADGITNSSASLLTDEPLQMPARSVRLITIPARTK